MEMQTREVSRRSLKHNNERSQEGDAAGYSQIYSPSGFAASNDCIDLMREDTPIPTELHSDWQFWQYWADWVESSSTAQMAMAVTILANALVIGLETDYPDSGVWPIAENMFLVIFSAELGLRMCHYGTARFFQRSSDDFGWNLLDFVIVGVGIVDCLVTAFVRGHHSAATLFRIIRIARIIRVFKLIRWLRQLYVLVHGLWEAAQASLWVTVLMSFCLYVCAVVLVRALGHPALDDPHYAVLKSDFGTIPKTMWTLFNTMASPDLASYSGVLVAHPMMAVFLIVFVIFGSFGMIGLLTGVISESMFQRSIIKMEEERITRYKNRREILHACADIFDNLDTQREGELTKAVLKPSLHLLRETYDAHAVLYAKQDLGNVLDLIDLDSSGTVNRAEFCQGFLRLSEDVGPVSIMEVRKEIVGLKMDIKREIAELHKNREDVTQARLDIINEVRDLRAEIRKCTAMEIGHEPSPAARQPRPKARMDSPFGLVSECLSVRPSSPKPADLPVPMPVREQTAPVRGSSGSPRGPDMSPASYKGVDQIVDVARGFAMQGLVESMSVRLDTLSADIRNVVASQKSSGAVGSPRQTYQLNQESHSLGSPSEQEASRGAGDGSLGALERATKETRVLSTEILGQLQQLENCTHRSGNANSVAETKQAAAEFSIQMQLTLALQARLLATFPASRTPDGRA